MTGDHGLLHLVPTFGRGRKIACNQGHINLYAVVEPKPLIRRTVQYFVNNFLIPSEGMSLLEDVTDEN